MGRKFAFITFLCLSAMIIMGLTVPDDPLFLFAAHGAVAIFIRAALALAMLYIAFGPAIRNEKLRSYLGLGGFGLIALNILVFGTTNGNGIYPYLQPADLLSGLIIGITCSISALEATPATSAVIPDGYFFYQELQDQSSNRKRIKPTPRHRPA